MEPQKKEDEIRILGQFTVSRMQKAFDRIHRYNLPVYKYPCDLSEGLTFNSYVESEGGFEKISELSKNLFGQITPVWKIILIWRQTYSDEFDLKSTESTSYNSSAYKMDLRKGPKIEVKFIFSKIIVSPNNDETIKMAELEIYNLDNIYKKLDFLSLNLSEWIKSGHGAAVRCLKCYRNSFLSNAKLRDYADKYFTVEDISSRLTCVKCKERRALLRIFPETPVQKMR